MNAFLLKNERKTLIKNTCLLFSQVFGFPLFDLVQVEYLVPGFLEMTSAVALSARKKKLKTRWVSQFMFFRIPPQEQGTRSQKWRSTRAIYPVNADINTVDNCSPLIWVRGKINRAAVNSSSGISVYKIKSAIQPGNDWLCSSPPKSLSANSLLKPAYTNKRMSRGGEINLIMFFIALLLMNQSTAGFKHENSMKSVYTFYSPIT